MVIGVDLGGTNIRTGLIDQGSIVNQQFAPLANKYELTNTLEQIMGQISSFTKYNISGIGIGVPSVVDVEEGIVFNATNIPFCILYIVFR